MDMMDARKYGGWFGQQGPALRFELLDLLRRVAVVALSPLARVARLGIVLLLAAAGHGVKVVAPGPAVVLGLGIPHHRAAVRSHATRKNAAGVVLPESATTKKHGETKENEITRHGKHHGNVE
jgi:hypothetical protein